MIGDFTGHDMAQAREDGYSAGVQLATQYERILADLIAELREGHPTFGDEPPLWVKTALYAAEARLREVGIG